MTDWGSRRDVLALMASAYESRDSDAWKRAEERFYETARSMAPDEQNYEREDAADRIHRALTTEPGDSFPLGFDALDSRIGGGLRRGQTMVLGGQTNVGKSMLVDQILESAYRSGAKCRLYLNEMSASGRDARWVQRMTAIAEQRVLNASLDDEEIKFVVEKAREEYPFSMTEIAGEGFAEVAKAITTNRDDVVAIDLISRFGFADESQLRKGAAMLDAAAKSAGSALILVTHLNEKRVKENGQRPPPTVGDVRDSQSLVHIADVVGFIWREYVEDSDVARMSLDGRFYLAKVRSGKTGAVKVKFHPETLSWEMGEM